MGLDDGKFDAGEFSREMGDRGDLVAVLTSTIGRDVEQGQLVAASDVSALRDALDEIEDLLETIEDAGVVGPGTGDGRASAD